MFALNQMMVIQLKKTYVYRFVITIHVLTLVIFNHI